MHKLIFALIILSISNFSNAAFFASVGGHGGFGFESKEKINGEPYLKAATGAGYGIGLEYGNSWFTVQFSDHWYFNEATTRYRKTVGGTTESADNVHADVKMNQYTIGPRLRILYTKYMRLFVGGGYLFGDLQVKHQNSYRVGPISIVQESEKQWIHGHYLETGLEIVTNENIALRIMAQRNQSVTGKFKTLDNKPIDLTNLQAGVQMVVHFELFK